MCRKRGKCKRARKCTHMLMQTMTIPVCRVLYVHVLLRSPLSTQYLPGGVCPLVHVFVCMFALWKTEDWQGLEGWPEIFDLDTYFHILVMSERAPVNRDKACFPACLQVINTLPHEVRNQARRWYDMVLVDMEEYSMTLTIDIDNLLYGYCWYCVCVLQ